MKSMMLLLAAVLLLLAPSTAAQQVTATSWEARADEPSSGFERGTSGATFVYVSACWEAPGLNPNDAKFIATLEIVSTPVWLNITPPDGPREWTPPQVATEATDCSQEEESWELRVDVSPTAPFGESGEVAYKVTMTTDQDPGTFMAMEGTTDLTSTLSIKADDNPFPGASESPGTDGGDGGDGGDGTSEEGPAPAPLAAILALVGLAALRRRHQ